MKNLFCSECGTPYPDLSWPRMCIQCPAVKWQNPVPVAAVVQPVLMPDFTIGIMIAKRAIEPMKGHWSLIGGFMVPGETFEQGAAREFREETGLELASTPKLLFNGPVGKDNDQLMLMTYVDVPLRFEVFEQAKPCPENEEIGLLFRESAIELAFPTHRDAVRKYFGERR